MANLKSWEVSNELWLKVKHLVPLPTRLKRRKYKRKVGGGRKPLPARQIFEAIIFVLRTGIQWKALPKEFGSSSSIHRYFQKWQRANFFTTLWKEGLMVYDEIKGIDWEWQSIDGTLLKAPLALDCVGANPTNRGRNGRKRSLLTDANGMPLAIVSSGANTHDVTLLEKTLDSIVVDRPLVSKKNKTYVLMRDILEILL